MNKGLFALFLFLTNITGLQQSPQAQTNNAAQTVSNSQTAVADGSFESSGTTKPGAEIDSAHVNANNVGVGNGVRLNVTPKPDEAELSLVYRVGVGDVLDVRLRNVPANKSSLFTVSASGLLEHPILTEPLKVLGLTTDEISQRIASDLKSRAIHEAPEVLVGVREYVSHTLLVSGLVKQPGQKVLRRERVPLYVVIAEAQPLPEAGRALVISQRANGAITVDLSNPRLMDLLVCSGDVITVQPSPKQYFYVGGEIKAPGEKSFRSRMTLTQAILTAGGLTRDARPEVKIAREGGDGRLVVTRYKLKDINSGKLQDPFIEPGDRITVAGGY
jgi:protein involved in polysaccharide export with SLBB domain